MKFFVTSLVSLLFALAVQAQFTINTPASAVECEPLLLSWTGGVAPYFLSIVPGGQPGAAALENLGQQAGTSFTWTVNVASGTSLGLSLRDSTGAVAQSAPFTVQAGGGSACLTAATTAPASTTTSAAAGGATTTPLTTTAAATTTTASVPVTTTTPTSTVTKPLSSGSSSGTSTSHASTSTTTSSSGAAPTARYAQVGVAGVVGAVIAAIIA